MRSRSTCLYHCNTQKAFPTSCNPATSTSGCWWACVFATLLCRLILLARSVEHQYCIVGAGVGDLHSGQYMLVFEQRHIVLMRQPFIGNAFWKLPPHGHLILIYKHFSGAQAKVPVRTASICGCTGTRCDTRAQNLRRRTLRKSRSAQQTAFCGVQWCTSTCRILHRLKS